jgi:hypothetical protein
MGEVGVLDCVLGRSGEAAGRASGAGGLRVMMQRSICYMIAQEKGIRGCVRARGEG